MIAYTEPMAQSFVFDNDETISAVGLYFDAKPATEVPISVEIHEMDGGFPSPIIHMARVVLPSEITVGSETKVTFERYLRIPAGIACCIVLLTESPDYKLQVATLGRLGQSPMATITENPYKAGVLFVSSNARTWSPVQDSDLRMKIYGRRFLSSAILEFDPASGLDLSDLFVGAQVRVPQGTHIAWEYELNGDNVVRPISLQEKKLLDVEATDFILRAIMTTDRDGVSPSISMSTVGAVGFLNALAGTYISRQFAFSQPLDQLHVYAHAAIPAGCTVTWYASNDDGVTWDTMSVDLAEDLDARWTKYSLSATFSDPAGQLFRLRADLTATSPLVVPYLGPVGASLEEAP
jgi:hypothetical protein